MEGVQVGTKQCTTCRCSKAFSEFHHNKASADGYTARCKLCTKEAYERGKDKAKKYYRQNREKLIKQAREYRERNRKHYDRNAAALARHRAGTNKYKKENPVKVKAQSAVHIAIMQGKKPKASALTCSDCGQAATEYHHWSYEPEHWLDVVPLCHTCHMKIHFGKNTNS